MKKSDDIIFYQINHISFSGSVIYICQPVGSIISAITTGNGNYVFNQKSNYFVCTNFNVSLSVHKHTLRLSWPEAWHDGCKYSIRYCMVYHVSGE